MPGVTPRTLEAAVVAQTTVSRLLCAPTGVANAS
jgi:hypothetical protein